MFSIFEILGNNEKWRCLPLWLAEDKARPFHGSSILGVHIAVQEGVGCVSSSQSVKENGGVRDLFGLSLLT